MSARKEQRQAVGLMEIGGRWKRLMDGGVESRHAATGPDSSDLRVPSQDGGRGLDARSGDIVVPAAANAGVAPGPSTPYAPTDAATSGRAMADAAGAPHGRHVDTERDGS